MNFNINMATVKKIGSVAGVLGKAIVIEGIKGVLLKSATNAITTSFDKGIDGVKKMTVEDFVGRKKKKLIEIPKVEVKSEGDGETIYAECEVVEKRGAD